MPKYVRTSVLSFSELPESAQIELLRDNESSDLHDSSFVPDPCSEGEYLNLADFIVYEGRHKRGSLLWSGVFGQSYFSAYYIKLSPSGDIATVGYRTN